MEAHCIYRFINKEKMKKILKLVLGVMFITTLTAFGERIETEKIIYIQAPSVSSVVGQAESPIVAAGSNVTNVWTHCVITCSNTTSRIYTNGVLASDTGIVKTVGANTTACWMGARSKSVQHIS